MARGGWEGGLGGCKEMHWEVAGRLQPQDRRPKQNRNMSLCIKARRFPLTATRRVIGRGPGVKGNPACTLAGIVAFRLQQRPDLDGQ